MNKKGADFGKLKMVVSGVSDFIPTTERNADLMWIYMGWDGVRAKLAGVKFSTLCPRDVDPVFDSHSPLIIAGESLLAKKPDLAKRFLAATAEGYTLAAKDPARAAALLLREVPELDEKLVRASADFLAPEYIKDATAWGIQQEKVWARSIAWNRGQKLSEGTEPAPRIFHQRLPADLQVTHASLRIQLARFSYGRACAPVLQDIALDLAPGDRVCLLGASGSGKSTLLRILMGLEKGAEGSVEVDGAVCDLARWTRAQSVFGLVPQAPLLFPWKTVEKNLALAIPKGTGKEEAQERIVSLLRAVGLGKSARLYPWQISLGMAARISFARALLVPLARPPARRAFRGSRCAHAARASGLAARAAVRNAFTLHFRDARCP